MTVGKVLTLALSIALLAQAALGTNIALAQPADTGDGRLGTRFILSDQRGGVVTDQDIAGSFLLIYFGYTHCPDVCPTSLLTMADVIDRLGAEADKVQALFVTVDPQRDTVEVLRDYVASFHKRLVGLTGSPEMIDRVVRGYRIKVERVEGKTKDSYTIDHTASLLFVSPTGEPIKRFAHGASAPEIAAAMHEAIASIKLPQRGVRR